MSTRSRAKRPSPVSPVASTSITGPAYHSLVAALVGALLLTTVDAVSVRAQSERQAVIAVAHRFFDGMRERDTAKMWSTVEPSTMLVVPSGPPGFEKPFPVGQFIAEIGKGTGPGGNERITHPTVQIDGPLAYLWAPYTYTEGGQTEVDHCGVDLFLLEKKPDGWKIFDLAGTIRKTGCAAIRP